MVVVVLASPCLGEVTVTDMREWGNNSLAAGGKGDKKVGEELEMSLSLMLVSVPFIILTRPLTHSEIETIA